MAKDYKHRVPHRDPYARRQPYRQNNRWGVVKWMAMTAVIIGFAVLLVYLKSTLFDKPPIVATSSPPSATPVPSASKSPSSANIQAEVKAEQPPAPPQFEFYTILPKKESLVPDHEFKTRTREAQVGKDKKTTYLINAGSFKTLEEAEDTKDKLALMGIEAKIQKAKVEDSGLWYLIKIGPYTQISTLNAVMSRLEKNGMKPKLLELKN